MHLWVIHVIFLAYVNPLLNPKITNIDIDLAETVGDFVCECNFETLISMFTLK